MPASAFRLLVLALLAMRGLVAGDAWTPIAPLPASISQPLAGVAFADGRVLVVGTASGSTDSLARAAAIWTPGTNSWSTAATPPIGTAGPAVRLGDGTALFIGHRARSGDSLDPTFPEFRRRYAEVFDPGTGAWTTRGAVDGLRGGGTLTPLADGSALFFGGAESSGSANPVPAVFRPTGGWVVGQALPSPGDAPGEPQGRQQHGAAPLAGGGAIVAGGVTTTAQPVGYTDAHLFSTSTLGWDDGAAPDLPQPRDGAAAVLLGDGSILIVGGSVDDLRTPGGPIRWRPGAGAWEPAGALPFTRAIRLAAYGDGRAVALGDGGATAFFDPATGAWTSGPVATGVSPDRPWVHLAEAGILVLDATPRALRPQTVVEPPPTGTVDVAGITLLVAADAQPTLDGQAMTPAGAGFWNGGVAMPGASSRSVRIAIGDQAARSIDVTIGEE